MLTVVFVLYHASVRVLPGGLLLYSRMSSGRLHHDHDHNHNHTIPRAGCSGVLAPSEERVVLVPAEVHRCQGTATRMRRCRSFKKVPSVLAYILGQKPARPVDPRCDCTSANVSMCVFLFLFLSRREERRLGSMLFPAFKLQKVLRAKVLLSP